MTKMPELRQLIADRIRAEGSLTFRDYMAMTLYEPGLGYYTSGRNPIGRGGDFYTSPTSTPLFGQLLARWLTERFLELGAGSATIVEMGAARGVLARDIKTALHDGLPADFGKVEYGEVEYGDPIPNVANACVISNELIDAFPVHRVRMTSEGLREISVTLDKETGGFVERLWPPSSSRLPAYLDYLGVNLPEGFVTEINLAAVDWLNEVAADLESGFVLTIDYGYESDELYAPYRAAGTMMGYYRHQHSDDLFAHIGRQDMTSHVNFSALMKYGEAAALETVSFTTQSDFLIRLGALELLETLQNKSIGDAAALRDYLALKGLLMPDGMGGVFKVLVQKKKAPAS